MQWGFVRKPFSRKQKHQNTVIRQKVSVSWACLHVRVSIVDEEHLFLIFFYQSYQSKQSDEVYYLCRVWQAWVHKSHFHLGVSMSTHFGSSH